MALNAFSQSLCTIKVVDSNSKEPIAFVNVKFDNSRKGVFTNIDGYCRIDKDKCDSIKVSYVGYSDTIFQISIFSSRKLNTINLQKINYTLSAAEIHPSENPAFDIIRKVVKNKKSNKPESLNSFSYTGYHKFIVTADIESAAKKLEENQFSDSSFINLTNFFTTHHLLIAESVSKRNYKFPNKNKEEVIASRFSGIKRSNYALLGTDLQSFSFYDKSIDVLDKHYINPINKASLNKYFYLLEDSIFSDFDTTYIISFRPYKGKKFDALKGQVHISSKNWAIKNIKAEPTQANQEFSVTFQQQYELIDNKFWFPKQINTDLIFHKLVLNGAEAKGISRSYIKELKINDTPQKRIRFNNSRDNRLRFNNEDILLVPMSIKPQSEEFWNKYRPKELDSLDLNTYHIIDSLSLANNLEKKLWAMKELSNGKTPMGKIDLMMNKLFAFNQFEKFRFGLGLQTNERLIKRINFGAYAAWATKDMTWKYGGYTNIFLWPRQSMILNIAHSYDVEESAQQYKFNKADFISYSELRNILISKMYYNRSTSAKISFRALPYSSWKISSKYSEIESPTDYEFILNSNTSIGDFNIAEVSLGWRFAYKEKLNRSGNTTTSMGTNYPILSVNYTNAISGIVDSELDYKKLDVQLDFDYNINFFGHQSWRITAGRTVGQAPWYKLYNGNGSYTQWYTEVPYSFGTMRMNEFLSDEYVALYFRHDFKSLLFGNKPFVPQPIFVTSAVFGSLSNIDKHKNINFNTLEKGYYESGLLLNSIFRSGITNVGIGFFYRWGPYAFDKVEDNFAYKLTVGYSI